MDDVKHGFTQDTLSEQNKQIGKALAYSLEHLVRAVSGIGFLTITAIATKYVKDDKTGELEPLTVGVTAATSGELGYQHLMGSLDIIEKALAEVQRQQRDGASVAPTKADQ